MSADREGSRLLSYLEALFSSTAQSVTIATLNGSQREATQLFDIPIFPEDIGGWGSSQERKVTRKSTGQKTADKPILLASCLPIKKEVLLSQMIM